MYNNNIIIIIEIISNAYNQPRPFPLGFIGITIRHTKTLETNESKTTKNELDKDCTNVTQRG